MSFLTFITWLCGFPSLLMGLVAKGRPSAMPAELPFSLRTFHDKSECGGDLHGEKQSHKLTGNRVTVEAGWSLLTTILCTGQERKAQ